MDYYYSVYHVPYFRSHGAHRIKRHSLNDGAISGLNVVKHASTLA